MDGHVSATVDLEGDGERPTGPEGIEQQPGGAAPAAGPEPAAAPFPPGWEISTVPVVVTDRPATVPDWVLAAAGQPEPPVLHADAAAGAVATGDAAPDPGVTALEALLDESLPDPTLQVDMVAGVDAVDIDSILGFSGATSGGALFPAAGGAPVVEKAEGAPPDGGPTVLQLEPPVDEPGAVEVAQAGAPASPGPDPGSSSADLRIALLGPAPPLRPAGPVVITIEPPAARPQRLAEPAAAALSADRPEQASPRGPGLAGGVMLTLGAASFFVGLHGALATAGIEAGGRTLVYVAAFTVLSAAAMALRSVTAAAELRSALGVLAVLCLPAVVVYGVGGGGPGRTAEEIALSAGLAGAAAAGMAALMPSAVAAALAAACGITTAAALVALLPGADAAHGSAAALVAALALAIVAPRLPRLRPHPAALPWLLGTAGVSAAVPAAMLASTGTVLGWVAGAVTGLALLAGAHRRGSVAMGVGAFTVLAAVVAGIALSGGSSRDFAGLVVIGALLLTAGALLRPHGGPGLLARLPVEADVPLCLVAIAVALAALAASGPVVEHPTLPGAAPSLPSRVGAAAAGGVEAAASYFARNPIP